MTNKRTLLLITLLAFFVCSCCSFGVCQKSKEKFARYDINTNAIYCNGTQGSTINLVLSDRIPLLKEINLVAPPSCIELYKNKLDAKIESYIVKDKSELEVIVNRYCSHVLGYEEINPGECSAGGPPPICVESHWRLVKPDKTIEIWRRSQQAIKQERERELAILRERLRKEACNCWLEDLKKQKDIIAKTLTPHPNDRDEKIVQSRIMGIPCSGPAPPSYHCENGYLVRDHSMTTPQIVDVDSVITQDGKKIVGSLVKDKVGDKIEDAVLNNIKQILPAKSVVKSVIKLYRGVPGMIVWFIGSLGEEMAGSQYGNYFDYLGKVESDINTIEKLLDELSRSVANKSLSRESNIVRKDLLSAQSRLSRSLNALTVMYNDNMIEHRSCDTCCNNTLVYYHSQLLEYCNGLLKTR